MNFHEKKSSDATDRWALHSDLKNKDVKTNNKGFEFTFPVPYNESQKHKIAKVGKDLQDIHTRTTNISPLYLVPQCTPTQFLNTSTDGD